MRNHAELSGADTEGRRHAVPVPGGVDNQRGCPPAQSLQAATREPADERDSRLSGVQILMEFHNHDAPAPNGLPRQQQVPGQNRGGPPLEDQHMRSLGTKEGNCPRYRRPAPPVDAVKRRHLGREVIGHDTVADASPAGIPAPGDQVPHKDGYDVVALLESAGEKVGVVADSADKPRARPDDTHLQPGPRFRCSAAAMESIYFPENALLTTAAAGFGVPFAWNKP